MPCEGFIMKPKFNLLYEEFLKGRKLCPIIEEMDEPEKVEFFIVAGHRIAFDEGYYDLFEKSYPNFFEYIKYKEEFVKRFFE